MGFGKKWKMWNKIGKGGRIQGALLNTHRGIQRIHTVLAKYDFLKNDPGNSKLR